MPRCRTSLRSSRPKRQSPRRNGWNLPGPISRRWHPARWPGGEWLLLPAPGSEGLNTAKLRVVRGGVLAGSVLKKRFQPAHALFMAYGADCTNREELTLADPRTAAWLRGEEIDAATAQNGWCAVLVDGFPLGGGKVSGGRIKNHYPKGLRNLQ